MNKFQALSDLKRDQENNLETFEQLWEKSRSAWTETCEEVLGRRRSQDKPWISKKSVEKIEARKKLKEAVNNSRTRQQKQKAQQQYQEMHKEARASIRRDKRAFTEDIALRGEEAAAKGNMRELYETTMKLAGKWRASSGPIRDQAGHLLTTQHEQAKRWAEYFETLLNQPAPTETQNIMAAAVDLNICCDKPTKVEITNAIKALKSGKAAGPDNIPPEALKHSINESTELLYLLFEKIWQEEDIPTDWKEGYIVKIQRRGICTSAKTIEAFLSFQFLEKF